MLDWVKTRGTTANMGNKLAPYEEIIFSWKRKVSNAIFEGRIHNEIILNLNQTPLETFTEKAAQSVPLASVNYKR